MTAKRPRLLWISPQGGLFSGMALAGLLAVALTVTADRGNAGGIDGLRAVLPGPSGPTDPIAAPPALPSPAAPPAAPATPAGMTAPASEAPVVSGTAPGGPPALTVPPPATGIPVPAAAPAPTPGIPAEPRPTPAGGSAPPPASAPLPAPATPSAPTPVPTPTRPVALETDRRASALVSLSAIVPGDTILRPLAVRNTGTSTFRYFVAASQTAGTALWTDTVDGLRLDLGLPDGTVLYSGPLSGLGTVATPNVVPPGGTDTLVYRFSLPAGASNAFQGLSQDLTIVLTAVEYP